MSEPSAEKDAPPRYWLTTETGVVHADGCRYQSSALDWPRWPGRNPRACAVCLPDGLPAWERDPDYPGIGRVTSPGGGADA